MKIRAILPWFGSKRVLAPRVVEQLGQHRCYWEPFCGSMAVLLAKPECSSETVNDLHGDLINLARVIQDERWGAWLYRRLRRTLVHESMPFEAEGRIQDRLAHAQGDVGELSGQVSAVRAADYFIACWLGRNGVIGTTKCSGGKSFCVRYTANGGIQGTRFVSAVESIPHWRRRMREVTILRRNGLDLLERIEDQDATAIYCDPPYLVKGAQYTHDFENEDHVRLAQLLRRFELARVVVSYYDHPTLADLYPDWARIDCTMTKALASQGARGKVDVKAQEVLLVNGNPYGQQKEMW